MVATAQKVSREDHLAWCKSRALECVARGDLHEAVASMISDMQKHPLTDTRALGDLAMAGMMDAKKRDARAVKRWIEDFD